MPSNAKPKERKPPLPPPSAQEVEQFKKDFQEKNGRPPKAYDLNWWKEFRNRPL
jgi:hypothetical protein